MAFEVTATRRRPQQFDSLAGQEFVVSTLKNAIAQGRIAHAYLFCGPRGVGKTTSARLLAKALNCVNGPTDNPCGECENCQGIAKGNNLDVIEIDGASNTSVNDIRVIKEEVMFPPSSSRYKIYIIDEVHMLSQSAFNALLKTIEEPPEYVVFIFATTEPQKVPATIRSRCQQFNFQLLGIETIKRLLREACAEMGIEAEDEALFWIAKEATGSMRDAYTLFDQVVSFSNGKITLSQIKEKLGLVGLESINSIMEDILKEDQSSAVSKVQDILARGVSIDQMVKDFTDYFRSLLLLRQGVKSENVLGQLPSMFPQDIVSAYNTEQLEAALEMFLKLYRDIRYSLNPRFELELSVSKLAKLKYVASNATVMEKLANLKNEILNGTVVSAPVAKPSVAKPPVAEQVAQKPVDIKDVLPAGVENFGESDLGFVLEFSSKFCYETALRDVEKIKSRVQKALGKNINVVLSFSEKLEQQRAEAERKAAVEKEEQKRIQEEAEAKARAEAKAKEPVVDEEHKFFVDDLITAFRGHEER